MYLDGGTLSYNTFAMKGQTNAVNTIPDFSYAGYKGGGVALPTVPVKQIISPVPGDDRLSIQNAIDAVEALPPGANGFRGAVLLTAGHYEVDGQLFIEKSGVVLRGEGQGLDGTVLHANMANQHTFLALQGTGTGIIRDIPSMQRITTAYVPLGSSSFDIADASGYSVGDTIAVRRTPNQSWINTLGMAQHGWTPSGYEINHERVITAIAGNKVTVNIPIVDVMETQYGGGEVYKATIPGRISHCGIENLRIESAYASDEDENHGWDAIRLRRVTDSWVDKVTAQYFGYSAVNIGGESNFNTIQESACLDPKSQVTGGRRYSFTIKDGLGNLFQRCFTRLGRHDYETGSKVTGPNVFLDNYSVSTLNDIGPHHRWSTGILFDNVRGGQMRIRNRGGSGTGHGWVSSASMFWNCTSYKSNVHVESPTGGVNWSIGNTGINRNGTDFWEHWNDPVMPRSLYLQQLEDRLGTTSLENVTIEQQRTGSIYPLLAAWAGEGQLIPDDTFVNDMLTPSADTYVRGGGSAVTNFGTDDKLTVKNHNSDDLKRESYLKFDLTALEREVSAAKIRLKVVNDDSGASHQLHLVADDSWTETGLVWNNKPAVTGSAIIEGVPLIGQWIEFDVTSMVNTEFSGDSTLSVRISESTFNTFVQYYSKEAIDPEDHPQLAYTLIPLPSISASADTYVRGGNNADINYGTDGVLSVKEDPNASFDRMGFLKFDLSALSGSVSSAKIKLKVQNDDPGAIHSVHLVSDDSWTETGITWNSSPSATSLIETYPVPEVGSYLEVDVTSEVNSELTGDGILSVRLSESSNQTFVSYFSKEAGLMTDHPKLEFELEQTPPSASMDTIPIVVDAFVRNGSSSGVNYGTDASLVVKNGGSAGFGRESYLKVDLSGVSGQLLSAKVRLKVRTDEPGTTHALRFVSVDSWTETGLTWNNRPSTGSMLDQSSVPLVNEWVEFDVTTQAQTELDGDGILSLHLSETTFNNYVAYHSSEAVNVADRPEFVYTASSSNSRFASEEEVASKELLLAIKQYPNPVVDGRVFLEFPLKEQGQVSVTVFDTNGRLIELLKTKLDQGDHRLMLNLDLQSGIYIYRIESGEFMKIGKLVAQ
ncbi:MAG: DNRLRE domain-containing protein [Bacteroidota bacterium]